MRILPDRKLDYKDLLIVPQRSDLDSRQDVLLTRLFRSKHSDHLVEIECAPIIASNMWNIGTIEMAKALNEQNMKVALHKYFSANEYIQILNDQNYHFITIGQSENDLSKLEIILNSDTPYDSLMICVDVANGYRSQFVDYVKKVREIMRDGFLMVGNVTTPEMVQELILAGADIVKIGIGPGSVCETRRVTGIGYPMASAIIECANAAHGLGGFICADGGCSEPSDICKVFCLGADFVMLGGMLAGTDECQGEWIERNNFSKPKTCNLCRDSVSKYGHHFHGFSCGCQFMGYEQDKYLKFFGMSSYEAMNKFGGSDKEYRASEGKCIEVPYKGPVSNVLKEICGGLRSCGSMIGAARIKDFPKCATFCIIN